MKQLFRVLGKTFNVPLLSAFLFASSSFLNSIVLADTTTSGDTTKVTVGTISASILGFDISLDNIIAGLVQLAIGVAGLIFFFMMLFGGLRYLMAGGDEKATTAARQTLTNAFIGLVIVVAAFLITQLLLTLFKVPGIKFG